MTTGSMRGSLIAKLYYERLSPIQVGRIEDAIRDFLYQRVARSPACESDICTPIFGWVSRNGVDALSLEMCFGDPNRRDENGKRKYVRFVIADIEAVTGVWLYRKWLEAKIRFGELKEVSADDKPADEPKNIIPEAVGRMYGVILALQDCQWHHADYLLEQEMKRRDKKADDLRKELGEEQLAIEAIRAFRRACFSTLTIRDRIQKEASR